MSLRSLRTLGLLAAALAFPALALGAGNSKPVNYTIALPPTALHATYAVEVNKKGQVVRIKSGTLSHYQSYDLMTIGNALQMWIRRPDGSSVAGLFRVNYDYDPKSQKVSRSIHLISEGGNWANDEGAAMSMVQTSNAYAKKAEEQLRRQQEQNLPDINGALKHSVKKSPAPVSH